MTLKIRTNYSPNFDQKKRKKTNIEFLIFHYTGMKIESDAIKKLTNFNSKLVYHCLKKWRNIKFSSRFIRSLARRCISMEKL